MFNPRSVSAAFPLVLFTSITLITSLGILLFSSREPFYLDDGLRHIVIAQQFLTNGLHTWHQYFFAGYFSTRDLNPWFLSDLVYVPTAWLNPVTGLKIATLWQISLLVCAFYLLLRQLHVIPQLQAVFIGLLLLGSEYFTLRLLLGRPFVLSTAVFFFSLWVILQRRYFVFALLTAVSVLLSHMFVFTFVLCVVSAFWSIWCEQGRLKSGLRIFTAWLGGAGFGLLLHPQQQLYVDYIREVFIVIPFSKNLGLGWEFSSGLLHADPPIFLILGLLPVLFVLVGRQLGHRFLFHHRASFALMLALSVVFFLGYLLWQRTIDYLWPLLLLTSAAMVSASPQIQNTALHELIQHRIWKFSILHLLLFIGLWHLTSLWLETAHASTKSSIAEFDALQNVPSRARVFNLDWDYFPAYLFFRPDLKYARGMDPTLDYKHSASDFQVIDGARTVQNWSSIKNLLECINWPPGTIPQTIENSDINAREWMEELTRRFEPQYLVIAKDRYPTLTRKLKQLKDLRIVGETNKIITFEILSAKPKNKES